jgi:hypothetical protein
LFEILLKTVEDMLFEELDICFSANLLPEELGATGGH